MSHRQKHKHKSRHRTHADKPVRPFDAKAPAVLNEAASAKSPRLSPDASDKSTVALK